ncbi:hypothetical protein RJ641_013392 [Dillenia turbinata]|uniref:Uncharacterized protein n=1 Tax=Dillenia turbinata TaxID=194707 RepID=A0AAN8W3W9_9MAGN
MKSDVVINISILTLQHLLKKRTILLNEFVFVQMLLKVKKTTQVTMKNHSSIKREIKIGGGREVTRRTLGEPRNPDNHHPSIVRTTVATSRRELLVKLQELEVEQTMNRIISSINPVTGDFFSKIDSNPDLFVTLPLTVELALAELCTAFVLLGIEKLDLLWCILEPYSPLCQQALWFETLLHDRQVLLIQNLREFPFLMAPTHELHQISVPQSTDDPYFRSILFFPLFGTSRNPLNSNIAAQFSQIKYYPLLSLHCTSSSLQTKANQRQEAEPRNQHSILPLVLLCFSYLGRTGIYLQIGTEIPTAKGMYLKVCTCGSRKSKSNPFRQVLRQVNWIREVLQNLHVILVTGEVNL